MSFIRMLACLQLCQHPKRISEAVSYRSNGKHREFLKLQRRTRVPMIYKILGNILNLTKQKLKIMHQVDSFVVQGVKF